jgi:hypothetical protein
VGGVRAFLSAGKVSSSSSRAKQLCDVVRYFTLSLSMDFKDSAMKGYGGNS